MRPGQLLVRVGDAGPLAVFEPRLDGSAGTECIRAGRDGTLRRWPVLKRINGGGQSCPR